MALLGDDFQSRRHPDRRFLRLDRHPEPGASLLPERGDLYMLHAGGGPPLQPDGLPDAAGVGIPLLDLLAQQRVGLAGVPGAHG